MFACPAHGSFIKDTPEDAAERFLREFAAKRKWSKPATGDDSEIDIHTPAGGAHRPEFEAWRWEPMAHLPALIIPFKRPVYEKVVADFAPFAGQAG